MQLSPLKVSNTYDVCFVYTWRNGHLFNFFLVCVLGKPGDSPKSILYMLKGNCNVYPDLIISIWRHKIKKAITFLRNNMFMLFLKQLRSWNVVNINENSVPLISNSCILTINKVNMLLSFPRLTLTIIRLFSYNITYLTGGATPQWFPLSVLWCWIWYLCVYVLVPGVLIATKISTNIFHVTSL